ncbi:MAG: hypothetical protein NTY02_18235 [Acidobacteria bacterium]|nr:hypothetical protein [Acidobacteriota bacterium]
MAARTSAKRSVPAPPARPLWLIYLLGWLIPGGGHLWLGRWSKGLVFLVMLPAMFVFGLALQGRLFPFEPSEPLVALAAIANVGMGLPYFVARALEFGAGRAVAVTYDYGNAFLIAAGLLNALVIIDAHDIALGRK